MTMEQLLTQTALNAKTETVYTLLERKHAAALQEQTTRFNAELTAAATDADKIAVASDWLEWLVG